MPGIGRFYRAYLLRAVLVPCFHQHVDTDRVRCSTPLGHRACPALQSRPLYALPPGQCSLYTSVSIFICYCMQTMRETALTGVCQQCWEPVVKYSLLAIDLYMITGGGIRANQRSHWKYRQWRHTKKLQNMENCVSNNADFFKYLSMYQIVCFSILAYLTCL